MVLLEIDIQTRVFIGIAAMVLLFSSFLIAFISSQRKKIKYQKHLQAIQEEQKQLLVKQNTLLEQRVAERTTEIMQQKETLQKTLLKLEASQLQLIQKEKLASLGELAAGVAHEIQNPLNFVNNFAELNTELIEEIREKLADENLPESFTGFINPIISDLAENVAKILQHGKRADSIVKNMLQHARTSTGITEYTDLHALVDEYLKLSFYGFRSKNKSFNCSIIKHYDDGIENVQVVPQDIGRTLVNLFDNAFYSINEKIKMHDPAIAGTTFEPALSVTTRKAGDKILLIIRDNGKGIPQKHIGKIFQPFFTTKPTGGNTGLGLSLSYDTIKAHQGDLKVESVEGKFAEFTIELNCPQE